MQIVAVLVQIAENQAVLVQIVDHLCLPALHLAKEIPDHCLKQAFVACLDGLQEAAKALERQKRQ